MFRHLIAILRGIRRIRPAAPQALDDRPAPTPQGELTAPAALRRGGAEQDPPSRQRLSWPARDLSRSRRLARAASDDETVGVRPPAPEPPDEGDDDATIVLPKPSRQGTEPR